MAEYLEYSFLALLIVGLSAPLMMERFRSRKRNENAEDDREWF